jgi:hypothetical protein
VSPEPIERAPGTALPEWMPRTPGGVTRLRCGTWWDAVRVPDDIGALALEMLAGRSGPVLASPKDSVVYWLVKPASAAGWNLSFVEVWGAACWLPVPCPSPGARHVQWLTPPRGDCLTDPQALRAALTEAFAASRGPHPEGVR